MSAPALLAYGLAGRAFEPFAPGLLRRRAARGKEDLARLEERLGRAALPRPQGPLVWLHGASVGECLSLLPLVERLAAARPDLVLLVTSGTVTSAQLLARRLPEDVIHQYVPLDLPGPARRFLQHWQPDLTVFVESELWPNLLLGAKRRGSRLALVSARLSAATVKGWGRARAAARELLGAFNLVLAQDPDTAHHLSELGARVEGYVNLKYAGDPLPYDEAATSAIRTAIGKRPILLAASTHDEDDVLSAAFQPLGSHADRPLLVVVPRHPARGPEVRDRFAAAFGAVPLRSAGEQPVADTQVYVADTLGELGMWFRLARACYVGGSLIPGVGGHNPLEPARLGCPAAAGTHVLNWRSVYGDLIKAQAVAVLRSPTDLTRFWRKAVERDRTLVIQAARARAVAEAQVEAVEAAFAKVEALLP